MLSQHARIHITASLSGLVYLALIICVVAFIALLAGTVVGDSLFDIVTRALPKTAPRLFAAGLGILIIGLIARAALIDIIGAGLMGLVLIATIFVHY
jgi:hypothetical protein